MFMILGWVLAEINKKGNNTGPPAIPRSCSSRTGYQWMQIASFWRLA